jgi:hypothetical protein
MESWLAGQVTQRKPGADLLSAANRYCTLGVFHRARYTGVSSGTCFAALWPMLPRDPCPQAMSESDCLLCRPNVSCIRVGIAAAPPPPARTGLQSPSGSPGTPNHCLPGLIPGAPCYPAVLARPCCKAWSCPALLLLLRDGTPHARHSPFTRGCTLGCPTLRQKWPRFTQLSGTRLCLGMFSFVLCWGWGGGPAMSAVKYKGTGRMLFILGRVIEGHLVCDTTQSPVAALLAVVSGACDGVRLPS